MTKLIGAEDMFLFAVNTGSFYPDFCHAARNAFEFEWWRKFVRKHAIPQYQRDCHEPSATMTDATLMIAAHALRDYYAEHVAEG